MRPLPLTLTTIILLTVSMMLSTPLALGFTAANNERRIDIDSVDIAPTMTPTPDPRYSPTPTIPGQQIAIPTEQSPKSIAITPKEPSAGDFFSFTLNENDIDFGVIDPTNPVIRTTDFILKTGTANKGSIFGYENHPLAINAQQFIPDTSCDDGVCDESISSLWQNTLTYGFGFRCDSASDQATPCSQAFANQQFYKAFADVSQKDVATSLLTTEPSKLYQGRITYKLNIPGTQPKGTYTNSIMFIAAPTF